jgi:hypothetical protein
MRLFASAAGALCALLSLPVPALLAQEASSGIDLRATVTAQAVVADELTAEPRNGSAAAAGFRSMLYPTWKMGEHWSFSGAIQINSRPWFPEDFSTQGYGLKLRVLQASLGYSKVWKNGSVVVRAGQMTSAFGAYLLRYDDADNPLLNMPMQYGYYYFPVTTSGLAGTQVDATHGRWDARVQLASSSPANPRSIFAKDQYANWAGGVGYTIRQGFRVGLSGYRGPYLDRHYAFYLPGESRPRDLPATAGGVEAEWARGHWNLYGEWQRFAMTYHAIPTFRQDAGYVEERRVLSPRWYVAMRAGYLHGSYHSGGETYETSVAYRPNARQLIKAGYSIERVRATGDLERIFGVQLVTTLHPLALALQ